MYGYRSESYSGSGVRDLAEILYFEIVELSNNDIPEYIIEHNLLGDNGALIQETRDAIHLNEEGELLNADSTSEWMNFCERIVSAVNQTFETSIKYGLWLTDKESCEKYYAKDGAWIDCYETSDVVLSDLGVDGKLYGYEEMPERIIERDKTRNKGAEK